MNKEKVFAWIESLEDMADQSDRYFVERTELYRENQEKDKEIERLKEESTEWESKCYKYQDIINELEKWLIDEYSKYSGAIRIANVLDKLKELKEGK